MFVLDASRCFQNKETPLHIAARVKDGEKCAEMLIKSGANVNAAQEVCDMIARSLTQFILMQNGETALHISARYGHLKILVELLEEQADPTWLSKVGSVQLVL